MQLIASTMQPASYNYTYGLLVTGGFMVTVDEAIIAKFDKDGKHFEILVDPQIAYDMKDGKTVSLSRMLAANIIFTDAKKGDKAASQDLQNAFDTLDVEKIAEQIVKKGEVQLTTEFRRKKTEEKRKQIAALISKYAVNPQTKLPHPQDRILNAMDIARVSIDAFKPAEQQVEEILKALKSVLPISMEETKLTVEIPAQYAGRLYGLLKDMGTVNDQQWLSNGSLVVKLTIPSGLRESVYKRLGGLTEGNAKIVEG